MLADRPSTSSSSEELERLRARSKRAYELGRVRRASARAALLTIAAGLAAYLLVGAASAWLLPITLLSWTGLGWRGGAAWSGARRGVLAGGLVLAIPTWFLQAGAQACPAPVLCAALGVAIGVAAGLSLHRVRDRRDGAASRLERAGGALVAALSVALLRCPSAPHGEGTWLVVGLVSGLVASATLTMLVVRRLDAVRV